MKIQKIVSVRCCAFYLILVSHVASGNISLNKADSLIAVLDNTSVDSSKVNLLRLIGSAYKGEFPGKQLDYLNQSLTLAKKINYGSGEAKAYLGLGKFYYNDKKYDQAINYYQLSKQRFGSGEHHYWHIDVMRGLGKSYLKLHSFDSAEWYLEGAVDLAKSLADEKQVTRCLNSLAICYGDQGFYMKALHAFEEVVELERSADNPSSLANAINNVAITYTRLENLDQSLKYYLEALAIKEKHETITSVLESKLYIGGVYALIEDYDHSLTYYTMVLKESQPLHNNRLSCLTHVNLSIVYNKMKQLDTALYHGKKALHFANLWQGIKTNLIGTVNLTLAEVYVNMNQFETALPYALVAKKQGEKNGDKALLAEIWIVLAEIMLGMNNSAKAIQSAEKALRLAQETQLPYRLKVAHEMLYLIYKKKGSYKQALYYQTQYFAYKDTIINAAKIRELGLIESKYELSLKEQANILLKEQKEKDDQLLEVTQASLRNQRNFMVMVVVALMIALITVYVLIRSHRSKVQLNTHLRQLNNEVEKQKLEISNQAKALMELNLYQERIIEERTSKIKEQSKKLIDYIFINSHLVRGPISRILGLLNLRKDGGQMETEDTLKYIDESIHELDHVVTEVAKKLEEGDYNIHPPS